MFNGTIRAGRPSDLDALTAIYNDAVLTTTAIWNERAVDAADRARWLEAKVAAGFPVLVAEQRNAVVGYATYGDFRPFDGFRTTVEHSLYVAAGFQRLGIGSALLVALEAAARAQQRRVMVAAIAADNIASLAFHETHGFIETGRMPEVGEKFGRRLDLVLMQKRP